MYVIFLSHTVSSDQEVQCVQEEERPSEAQRGATIHRNAGLECTARVREAAEETLPATGRWATARATTTGRGARSADVGKQQ